jgi:hypothetical protein
MLGKERVLENSMNQLLFGKQALHCLQKSADGGDDESVRMMVATTHYLCIF